MSQVEDLTRWNQAAAHMDKSEPELALQELLNIVELSSKIRFNMGLIYERMGFVNQALQIYTDTITQDEHFAVGYFQRGCVHFKEHSYSEAFKDFIECEQRLRGKNFIDYAQLGMRHKLYKCDVLHNQGLCYVCQGDYTRGMDSLLQSQKAKAEARHKIIDETLAKLNNNRHNVKDLQAILLPPTAMFRPPKSKIAHMQPIDYLGKAKVVTSEVKGDKFAGFSGVQMLEVKEKNATLAKSAPSSPTPARHRDASTFPQSATPKQLFDQLNRALGPDQDKKSRPDSHDRKSKTPPARWSPTRLQQKNIPPPPTRPMPTLPQPVRGTANKAIPDKPSKDAPVLALREPRRKLPVPNIRVVAPDEEEPAHNQSKNALNGTQNVLRNKKLPASPTEQPISDEPPPLPAKCPIQRKPAMPASEKNVFHSHINVDDDTAKEPIITRSRHRPTGSPSNLVEISFHCVGQKELSILSGIPLSTLMDRVGELFDLPEGSYDIWTKDSRGEFQIVSTNTQMQAIWSEVTGNKMSLWVFGK